MLSPWFIDAIDAERVPTAPTAPPTSQGSPNWARGSPPPILEAPRPPPTAPLKVVCGPLLRYDTIDGRGQWRGAVLLVTADRGSKYEPHPMLILEWDPDPPVPSGTAPIGSLNSPRSRGPLWQRAVVPGQEIHRYVGMEDAYTFWRFLIEIPLAKSEMNVLYNINRGRQIPFYVPGITQNMRWAAHSCNGFSVGVDEEQFYRKPQFDNGYDPVWSDLLAKHTETPFHVLVGGGDQLYCDKLTREPELQAWLNAKSPAVKQAFPISVEIQSAIDRFYFNNYCNMFRKGAFARANRSIPMLNMLDDHDLIDGFGSYPEQLQRSPVFSTIGSQGYFWFLLFQLFTVDEVDGTNTAPRSHTYLSTIIGSPGAYVPFPSHSILTYLGPQVAMVLLDARAERRKDQVCSRNTYETVFREIKNLGRHVEHLVFVLGIPIAYPRLNFLEKTLDSNWNPLNFLGRKGAIAGFVNNFNAEAELLDDLNDHWTAAGHKQERNWFIRECQGLALSQQLRITFVSGDVHCAAVGAFMSLNRNPQRDGETARETDHRFMLNIITSAIVNKSPTAGVISLVNRLSEKEHKTMHDHLTDEKMLPVFATNPDGTLSKSKYIHGARNYATAAFDEFTRDLIFEFRLEEERGVGTTVGYPIRTPRLVT